MDGLRQPQASTGVQRSRSAWLAFLASFLGPGLGHLYAGVGVWALGALVLAVSTSWIAVLALRQFQIAPFNVFLAFAIAISSALGIALHAAWSARRAPVPFLLRWYHHWWSYLGLVAIWIAHYELGLQRVIGAYHTPSGAMEPTIQIGDRLLKQTLSRRAIDQLSRGDIVLHESVEEPGLEVLKRLVGLPGDTLEMRNDSLFCNGQFVREPYARYTNPTAELADAQRRMSLRWQLPQLIAADTTRYLPGLRTWGPLVVPPASYFVLGDERDASYDSRYWGFVPRGLLRSRPWMIYYSSDRSRGGALAFVTAVRWERIGTGIP